MATTGIWNQHAAASISLATAHPMDGTTGSTGSSGSSSSSDGGATISANDFLTLLVTEMQNQDPTADTDPNEYINQLVNVNSLEQLIQINQTLSSATSGTPGNTSGAEPSNPSGSAAASTPSSPSGAGPATVHASAPASVAAAAAAPTTHLHPAVAAPVSSPAPAAAAGNLAVPKNNPAAQRVAQSLGARFRRN